MRTTVLRHAQPVRGRTLPAAEMDRQLARWRRLMGRRPRGWASVAVLTRDEAARIEAFAFVPAVTGALAAARM